MPQRLPAIFTLGAISLLASVSPGQAEVTPVHRPPAVPPLPTAQPLPSAQPIALSQSPLADPGTPHAASGASASAPVEVSTSAPADAAEVKRDAAMQGDSNIAIASFAQPIDLVRSFTVKFSLGEAPTEAAQATAQVAQDSGAQAPAEAKAGAPAETAPSKSADDIAKFLPDIELKDISQETKIGYHASYAPLPSQDVPADAPEPVQMATLALPDIAPIYKPSVGFGFNAPLSLYVGGVASDDSNKTAQAEPASTTPRPRPEGVVASIDAKPVDPEKVAPARAEPVFRLRR